MSRTAQTLLAIKRDLAIRHIPVEDFASEYDRLQTGRISPEQLQRTFSHFRIQVRPQDLQDLILYLSEGNQVSTRKLIAGVKAARESDAVVYDRSACSESLHQISKYLSIRQLTLRDAVRPFDKANRGKVPVADFVRAIGCPPHTQVVADTYKDPYSGLVAYFQVEEDMNALKITKVTPPAVQAVIEDLSLSDQDVRKLFERLQLRPDSLWECDNPTV
jgi:hypothetical protein